MNFRIKNIWEYIYLTPFFLALILQMITICLTWLMIGLGTSVVYIKDWSKKQIQ